MVFIEQMSEPQPDDLARKLRSWQVDVPRPADFQRQVWQRIATEESVPQELSRPRLLEWIERCGEWLNRPAAAIALLTLSLTSGVLFARIKAGEANARSWHVLEERYAAAVNPLVRHIDDLGHAHP